MGLSVNTVTSSLLLGLLLLVLTRRSASAAAFCPIHGVRPTFRYCSYHRSEDGKDTDTIARYESDGAGDDGGATFDMEQLQRRIDRQTNQYCDLLASEEERPSQTRPPPPDVAHIILFNPGTEEQGVHTIEFPKGSGNNTILAFESGEECLRFSQMLKDMHFFDPVAHAAPFDQLEDFCASMGVPLKVVPGGKDLRPPPENVDTMGMDPDLGKKRRKLDTILLDGSESKLADEENNEGSWE